MSISDMKEIPPVLIMKVQAPVIRYNLVRTTPELTRTVKKTEMREAVAEVERALLAHQYQSG